MTKKSLQLRYHSNCCGVTYVYVPPSWSLDDTIEAFKRGAHVRYDYKKVPAVTIYGYRGGIQYWFKLKHTLRDQLEPILREMGFELAVTNQTETIWIRHNEAEYISS